MNLRRAGRFNLDIEADENGELIARSWETLDGWEDAVARRERIETEHEVHGDRIVSSNRFEPGAVWIVAFWSKVTDGVRPLAVVNRDDCQGWIYEVTVGERHVYGLPEGARSVCVWADASERVIRGTIVA